MNDTVLFITIIYITSIVFSVCAVQIDQKQKIEEPIPQPAIVETVEQPQEEIIEEPKKELKYLGKYKITYYCACQKCCGKTNGITASGEKAVAGITIAAPKNIPFNTKLLINEHVYTVQDRGGSIKNNILDIYCNTHEEALKNGIDYYDVYEITE